MAQSVRYLLAKDEDVVFFPRSSIKKLGMWLMFVLSVLGRAEIAGVCCLASQHRLLGELQAHRAPCFKSQGEQLLKKNT